MKPHDFDQHPSRALAEFGETNIVQTGHPGAPVIAPVLAGSRGIATAVLDEPLDMSVRELAARLRLPALSAVEPAHAGQPATGA